MMLWWAMPLKSILGQAFHTLRATTLSLSVLGGVCLSGCSQEDEQRTQALAYALDTMASVDVGAPTNTQEPTTSDLNEGVKIAYETAKDVAIGPEGLSKKPIGKMSLAVVSAGDIGSYEDGRAPLDVRPHLPADNAPVLKPEAVVEMSRSIETTKKSIQLGSYSSLERARAAWAQFKTKSPGLEQYRIEYQPVTTPKGLFVRLRLGPVDQVEAKTLCETLGVKDSWCQRAS